MSRNFICSAVLFLLCAVAWAQDVPAVRAKNTEIGLFAGASHGVDQFRVMGGGNVSYAVTRVFMPYAEFSYFPGIRRKVTIRAGGTGNPITFNFSQPLADFHGGVHIRIPLGESRVVPYLVVGVGGLRSFSRTENVTVTDVQGTFPLTITQPATTDFAANFGGGLRAYVNERFGVRLEAKTYRPTGTYTDFFYKVEGGIFFQIH